jgi:hypothetical protein
MPPRSAMRAFARRGHQRCHCNEEGFGTLSGSSEIMEATAVPVWA